ncbi:MAG: BCD family MFS transporter [Spirochaetota bacterium]
MLNVLRLGFFPLAYGLTGAFIGGTLNRVMIADLGMSAALVGLLFALPLLLSPARLWFGYRSDAFPIVGLRREPYLVLGALIVGISLFGSTVLAVRSGQGALVMTGLFLAFLLYGVGRNLSHNTFQALLADLFKGDQRPRAVTGYEIVTLLGLVAGAGALGQALERYDPQRLVSVAAGASVVLLMLTLLAAPGQEPRDGHSRRATEAARAVDFRSAVREYILKDRQARLFFGIVLFTFVGTLAQDVFLEPYGALVLGMSVGETTRLTAFWGVGIIVAMLFSGGILIKWLGHMRVLRIGIGASALVFLGVIVAGLLNEPTLFRGLVLLMGFGTGLAGAGMLTGVINFTTEIRAGLLMGLWGMANMTGRAIGSLMGGGVVELVTRISGGRSFIAYAAVFALEIAILVLAYLLTVRFDLAQARAREEARASMDGPIASFPE